jgi:hypothetical protein
VPLLSVRTPNKKGNADLAFALEGGLIRSRNFVAEMATEIEDRLKSSKK